MDWSLCRISVAEHLSWRAFLRENFFISDVWVNPPLKSCLRWPQFSLRRRSFNKRNLSTSSLFYQCFFKTFSLILNSPVQKVAKSPALMVGQSHDWRQWKLLSGVIQLLIHCCLLQFKLLRKYQYRLLAAECTYWSTKGRLSSLKL